MQTTQNMLTREDAETRAQTIFMVHAGVFVGVNAMLAYLDLKNDDGRVWFYWPLAGWGVGLAAHAYAVFVTHRAADRVIERVSRRADRQENRENRKEERADRREARQDVRAERREDRIETREQRREERRSN